MLAVALILAGCGGSGNDNWQQVQGTGFVFNAPAAWNVAGAAASSGPVNLVEVRIFRLLRVYDPARRAAIGRELDRVVDGVAGQLKGSISSRRGLVVDGLDARTYTVLFGGKTEEITFVLRGRREYQLLCRHRSGAGAAPCAELLRSFSLR